MPDIRESCSVPLSVEPCFTYHDLSLEKEMLRPCRASRIAILATLTIPCVHPASAQYEPTFEQYLNPDSICIQNFPEASSQ